MNRSGASRASGTSHQGSPVAAGAGSGPVTIFGFGQPPGLGAVHQAGLSDGIFLDSPGDLDAHAVAFTRLRASALSGEDSARLLCRLAGR